jgi:hypothetical protein
MRPPGAIAALALLLVLALAACGGDDATQTGSQRAIPGSVADRLAAMSDSIASSWAAGDECGAARQADELRHATDEAISSGAIPVSYRDELEAAVTNLQNTANCPAPAPPPAPDDKGEPKPKGGPKGEDKDKKGHDKPGEGVATTTGTTTAESG